MSQHSHQYEANAKLAAKQNPAALTTTVSLSLALCLTYTSCTHDKRQSSSQGFISGKSLQFASERNSWRDCPLLWMMGEGVAML